MCVFVLSSVCTYRSQRSTVDVFLYWPSALFFETGSLTELSLARVATQQALELPISAPRAGNTDRCSSPWLSWRCWWSNFKSSYFHNKHYIYLPSHPTPQHKLWSSGRIGSACNHWAISPYPVPYGEWERIAIQPSLQCECTWSNFHLSLTSGGGYLKSTILFTSMFKLLCCFTK